MGKSFSFWHSVLAPLGGNSRRGASRWGRRRKQHKRHAARFRRLAFENIEARIYLSASSADFTGDMSVDRDDLVVWETGFGNANPAHGQGDADWDGDVDGSDFLAWQRQFGQTLLAVAVADFDGDGRDDLVHFHSATNTLVAALGAGGGIELELDPAGNWTDFQAGDFNGDGRDDLMAFDSNSSEWTVAISDSTQFTIIGLGASSSTDWIEIHGGDFDGDGSQELLGRNPATAQWNVLQYDEKLGASQEAWGGELYASNIIYVGDANGDGRDDLFARANSGAPEWSVSLSRATDNVFAQSTDWGPWFEDLYLANPDMIDADQPYQQIIDIFSEVYNNVELELYPGLMKGIEATQQTGAGNPWDQAALLVDRLEQVGVEANIATGQVKVAVDPLQQWLGAKTAAAAYNIILNTLDNHAVKLPQSVQFKHAWVRAKVPTTGGLEWVDLDPSWKFKDRQEGIEVNLASAQGTFDELGFLSLNPETDKRLPVEYFEETVMQYLVGHYPGKSLADVAFDGPIRAKVFHRIPEGLGAGVTVVDQNGNSTYDDGDIDQYANLQFITGDHVLSEELTHRVTVSLERDLVSEARASGVLGNLNFGLPAELLPTGATHILADGSATFQNWENLYTGDGSYQLDHNSAGTPVIQLNGTQYVIVSIPSDYNVTDKTHLRFDFEGNGESENYHLIGLDGDNFYNGQDEYYASFDNLVAVESGVKQLDILIGPQYLLQTGSPAKWIILGMGLVDGVVPLDTYARYGNFVLYEGITQLVDGNSTIQQIGAATAELAVDMSADPDNQPYRVTKNTVLAFDFKSGSQGRLHALGWDVDFDSTNDDDQPSSRFQLYGTGSQPGYSTEYNNYSGGDYSSYNIPLGTGLNDGSTASLARLVFVTDAGSITDAESRFKNFRFLEDTGVAGLHWESDEIVIPEHSLSSIHIDYVKRAGAPETNLDDTYRSRLWLDGDDEPLEQGEEYGVFQDGDKVKITLNHLAPTAFYTEDRLDHANRVVPFTREPGEIVAIGLDANQYSRESLADLQGTLLNQLAIGGSAQDYIEDIDELLSYTAARYWYDFNRYNKTIAGLTGTVGVQQWVGSGVVTAKPNLLTDMDGNYVIDHLHYSIAPVDMGVDLPNINHVFYDDDTTTGDGFDQEAYQLMGYNSSALEHSVVEEVINSKSASTMKGLRNAYQTNTGLNSDNYPIEDDRIYVFSRSSGGTIRWENDWYSGNPDPDKDVVISWSDVAPMLADHTPEGGGENTVARSIEDILRGLSVFGNGDIRVLVPKGKSQVDHWIGSAYVVEAGSKSQFKIAKEGGTTTNGGYSGNLFKPENTLLPTGTFLNQTYAGDPVNIANGNMFRDEVDFVFPNRGIPLTFGRHYSAQNDFDVGFGVGWTHSFTSLLYRDPDAENNGDNHKIVWLRADGSRHAFERADANSEYEAPASLFGEFETLSGNDGYVYREKNGVQYTFDTSSFEAAGIGDGGTDGHVVGRLTIISDRNSDFLNIEYDNVSPLRVDRIEDGLTQLRHVEIDYDDSGSQVFVKKYEQAQLLGMWTYGLATQAGNGGAATNQRLASVTSPTDSYVTEAPAVQYSYYPIGPSAGLMEKITEPDGAFHDYTYYPNGRIFQVTDREGSRQTFHYNLFRNLTEFTDERGNTETYIHQDNGLLLKQIHPDRTRQEFTWGAEETPEEFLMTSTTDERGAIETFHYYDGNHPFARELEKSTSKHYLDAGGPVVGDAPVLTHFEYFSPTGNPHIRKLSKITVDPDGTLGNGDDVVTQFTHDGKGRLLDTTDAEGNTTLREYYADNHPSEHLRGMLMSITSPRDLATLFQYDTAGNVTSATTDGLPSATNIHDHHGNVLQSTDPTGVITKSVYDVLGRLRKTGWGDGSSGTQPLAQFTSTFQYDTAGRLRISTDPLGNTNELVYDIQGELTRRIKPDGTMVSYEYDSLGNRISQTDALGRTTRFVHDSRNRLVQTIRPDDATEYGASELARYDGVGRVVSSIDPLGQETKFAYDAAGRLLTTTNAAGDTGANVYDSLGNLTFSIDLLGNTTQRQYDKLGRVTETRMLATSGPLVSLRTIDYDASGNVTRVTTFDTIGLDAAGIGIPPDPRDLITTVNPEANLVQGVETRYDSLNRPVETVYVNAGTGGGDTSTRTSYDAAGRVRITYDELGRESELRYDAYGRLAELILPDPGTGSPTTTYQVDAAGNQTASTNSNGDTTRFVYDALGRNVATIGPLGGRTQTVYDLAGQRVATVDALGRASYVLYDSCGRPKMARAADPDGNGPRLAPETEFEYDAAGNLSRRIDPLGYETRFAYDQLNRLTREEFTVTQVDVSASTPQQTVWIESTAGRTFAYDAAGNRTSSTDTLGRTTDTTYDELGRVESVWLPDPDDFSASGGVNGPLPRPLTTITYDGYGNAIRTAHDRGGGSYERTTEWFYDARNRVLGETLDSGGNEEVTTTFEYDDVGNRTKTIEADGAIGVVTDFSYDRLDRPRAEVRYPGNSTLSTTYAYDATGHVTQIDTTTVTGGDTHRVTTLLEYDKLGRQTRSTLAAGGSLEATSRFQYDAAGNLMREIDPLGRVTQSDYDRLDRLVQTTLPDPDGPTGPLTSPATTFAYDSAGNLVARTNGEGETTRQVHDSLGRQVRAFDTLGNETLSRYDSAGNLLSLTDPEANVTTYVYDRLNRLTDETITLPAGGDVSRTYQYNAQGNLQETTDRNGRQRIFSYDRLDRRTAQQWTSPALAGVLTWRYDALGRVTLTQDDDTSSRRIETFDYDELGRVTAARNYDPTDLAATTNPMVEQRATYDLLDAPGADDFVRTEYSQHAYDGSTFTLVGETTRFTDRLGRMAKLEDAVNPANGSTDKEIDFTYDVADQLTGVGRTANAGVFRFDTLYNYDGTGRVTSIAHHRPLAPSPQSPFTTYGYQYDAANRITRQTTGYDTSLVALSQLSATNIEDFLFDDAGQLTTDAERTYAYDDNGNRISGDLVIGPHNRLTEDADTTYQYDHEGNLIRRDAKASAAHTEYTWDHRNRLTTVEIHDEGGTIEQRISYRYDADDRLVFRAHEDLAGGPITTEHYVTNGTRRVLTLDDTGLLKHRYVHGPTSDQVLFDEVFDGLGQAADLFAPVANHLQSTRMVLDGQADIDQTIDYNSFGSVREIRDAAGALVVVADGPAAGTPDTAALDTIFTHAGSAWDDQARLTLKGRRPYDPGTGRFLSEDPIGFADGPNPYRYAGNDPVNFRDPTGLSQAGNPLNNLFGTYDGLATAPGLYSSNLPLFSDQLSAHTQVSSVTSDLGRTYDVAQVNGRQVVFDPVSKIETGLQLQNIHGPRGGIYTAFVSPGENLMILENPSTGTQAAIAGVAFAGAGIVGAGVRGGWAAGATAFGREVVGETVQTGLEIGIQAGTGANIPIPIGIPSRGSTGGSFTTPTIASTGGKWQSLGKGVRIKSVGTGETPSYWIKSVDPDASAFWQSWGRVGLNRQAQALTQLGDLAPNFVHRNGKLILPHVGKFEGSAFSAFKISLQAKLRLRTPFDDAHSGNIGANGLIFDPAVHPVNHAAYWTISVGAGVGTGYAYDYFTNGSEP